MSKIQNFIGEIWHGANQDWSHPFLGVLGLVILLPLALPLLWVIADAFPDLPTNYVVGLWLALFVSWSTVCMYGLKRVGF